MATVIALSACSAVRLGYANGDSFMHWWLNRYVNLSEAQSPWLREELAQFMQWHRRTQLPDYAALLAQAQLELNAPVSTEQVQQRFAMLRERAMRSADHMVPMMARLATSLTPEQIHRLEQRFAKSRREYQKTYLDKNVEAQRELRFEKVVQHAQRWFGKLTPAQQGHLREMIDARPVDYSLWYREQAARQNALLAMLWRVQKEAPEQAEVAQWVRHYLAQSMRNFTYAEHARAFDQARIELAEMTAQLINDATPTQRDYAHAQLQRYINDANALSGAAQLSNAALR